MTQVKKSDDKFTRPEPETGPPWQIRMQFHKFMIFNSASDNQTYLYAAGRHAKDVGQEAVAQGGK